MWESLPWWNSRLQRCFPVRTCLGGTSMVMEPWTGYLFCILAVHRSLGVVPMRFGATCHGSTSHWRWVIGRLGTTP